MKKNTKTTESLAITAMMMCLIMVSTMFFKVPIPFAHGYVHLGDAMIYISVLILGWRRGAAAGSVGSALGDVLGGFAIWAPWTLVIKGAMAIIAGCIILAASSKGKGKTIFRPRVAWMLGMFFAGVWMAFGYYIAEGVIYGNWYAPLLGVPWNIGQFITGMIIAGLAASALYKTSARRFFADQS